jgi:Mitochondrial ribosomal protein subunit L20
MRGFSTQYSRPRLAKYVHNSLISSSTQRRHFVKPRTKVRDPLESAPSAKLDYPSITETKGLEDDGYSQKKLTFIHRPPPTSPSPHSMITAPASPLLRPATPHKPIFKGVVKLRPGESPVIIGGHKQTRSSERESETDSGEPPLLRSYPHIRRRHLGEEDLARMRTLRETNPQLYTRQRLAKMFDCSPVFVSMAAPLPREALKEVWREKLEQKEGWTWRKQLVREMRKKRKDLW